ncbi:MAG: hypothetical protein SGBAC_004145 [Bacillariaceae sp.]
MLNQIHSPIHPSPEDCITILQILDTGGDQRKGSISPRKKRRKVQFAPSPSLGASAACSTHPASATEELWYTKSEIREFKAEARQLVHSIRSPKDFIKDDLLRGLESSTLERRLFSHKTIQCTLSAYKKNMNPEDVAKIARICGTWNAEIALVQACRDYSSVYNHEMQAKVPKVSTQPPAFPFALRKAKSRALPQCHPEQPERSVRRRVS